MRTLKRKLRRFIDSFYSKKLPTKRAVGTGDTWTILTKNLSNPVVVSGGAGKNISFEIEMVNKYGAKVLLFDPSPTGQQTINDTKDLPAGLRFFQQGISGNNGSVSFSRPQNSEEGSFRIQDDAEEGSLTFECKTVSSIALEHNLSKIDILKIDIEGFEYEVIDEILDSPIKIDQICIEFHHFFDYIDKKTTLATQKKLRQNGYKLFHKSGLDFSYIRESLLK